MLRGLFRVQVRGGVPWLFIVKLKIEIMYSELKTEVNVKQFAKNLAHSDDNRQGDFINKLAYELKICCRDSDLSGMQACTISDKLDSNGIDFIKSLNEFIGLREKNKPLPK